MSQHKNFSYHVPTNFILFWFSGPTNFFIHFSRLQSHVRSVVSDLPNLTIKIIYIDFSDKVSGIEALGNGIETGFSDFEKLSYLR